MRQSLTAVRFLSVCVCKASRSFFMHLYISSWGSNCPPPSTEQRGRIYVDTHASIWLPEPSRSPTTVHHIMSAGRTRLGRAYLSSESWHCAWCIGYDRVFPSYHLVVAMTKACPSSHPCPTAVGGPNADRQVPDEEQLDASPLKLTEVWYSPVKALLPGSALVRRQASTPLSQTRGLLPATAGNYGG